jgi:hypothetical protein
MVHIVRKLIFGILIELFFRRRREVKYFLIYETFDSAEDTAEVNYVVIAESIQSIYDNYIMHFDKLSWETNSANYRTLDLVKEISKKEYAVLSRYLTKKIFRR